MDEMNASVFQYLTEVYELEFEKILSGITLCYKMMRDDKVPVPLNDENGIRDILLLRYLKNRKIREKFGLIEFRFIREVPEDSTQGRVDIRILSKNDFENDDAYYVVECKRIDNKNLTGTTGLNAEYIKNGIIRFVTEYYSSFYRVNGMIGFVVDKMDINENISNLNQLLNSHFANANTVTCITPLHFINELQFQYFSIHEVLNNRRLKLYLLIFDFSASDN